MAVDPKSLRIVYMGTPEFAVAPLRALHEAGYNVVSVVTGPDKPAGRGLKLKQSPVKEYAVKAGLPVMQPVSLKTPEFAAQLAALKPDLGIVVAFRMLPETVFSLPRYGTFNLHTSLLPQYRGAAPINRAIMNGEHMTGVTTFLLDKGMDEGAIIDSRKIEISDADDAGSLHDKLMEIGAGLVVSSVGRVVSDGFRPLPQHISDGTELKPAPKIFRDTCRINFDSDGRELFNFIRGLSPYPGAWAELVEENPSTGEELRRTTLKIFSARFEPCTAGDAPGTVLVDNISLKAVCRDGVVEVLHIQPSGKPRMDIREFLNGFKCRGTLRFE